MLLDDSKEQALLAKTGIFRAAHLLRRQESIWKSYFVLLNDHTLTFCCSENKNVITYVLLTSNTRVYDEEIDVFRIETGLEVLVLKGQEMNEWKRAISMKVRMLSSLARGRFRVTHRGRSRNYFMMLHKECITAHRSPQNAISRIYPISNASDFFVDKGTYISFRSGSTLTRLTMRAKTAIEHKHWVFALTSLQKGNSPSIAPSPPLLPLHSGTLEFLDLVTMKWKNQYVVLSDTCCLYTHDHRKEGTPRQYVLTPNSMIYKTNLANAKGRYSFQLGLFSECLHVAAATRLERDEWLSMVRQLIPKSKYDTSDILQSAALERDVGTTTLSIESVSSPGICLQARGNWMVAAVVSESLSSSVCRGSILSSIGGVSSALTGVDYTSKKLTLSRGPLHLSFWKSPTPEAEKVYATLSSGTLTLYAVVKKQRQGREKLVLRMRGASVGLENNCFTVYSGLKVVQLQAVSRDDALGWATNICQSISMENGGGLLLDKEKQEEALHGSGVTSNADELFTSVQVFATSKSNAIETTLDVTQTTEATDEDDLCDTTFNSLDPVEVSHIHTKMEAFALNFFHPSSLKGNVTDTQAWLDLDRVSSIVSDEEVLDAYSDIDNCNHINSEDYVKLKRLASEREN
eukprot:scaffold43791_cov204-Skeletonema_marinoi.AAC.3